MNQRTVISVADEVPYVVCLWGSAQSMLLAQVPYTIRFQKSIERSISATFRICMFSRPHGAATVS